METSLGIGVPIWVQSHRSFAVVALLWTLFWAGLALWHSAKRGKVWWFLAFLFIHTLGLLEIVFLFGVLRLKFADLFKK
jgi:hypothetical protein